MQVPFLVQSPIIGAGWKRYGGNNGMQEDRNNVK